MAAIEMILLIAFSKYSKLQPLMKLLQVLEVQSSGTPFLEQMEAKLNYIGKFLAYFTFLLFFLDKFGC